MIVIIFPYIATELTFAGSLVRATSEKGVVPIAPHLLKIRLGLELQHLACLNFSRWVRVSLEEADV